MRDYQELVVLAKSHLDKVLSSNSDILQELPPSKNRNDLIIVVHSCGRLYYHFALNCPVDFVKLDISIDDSSFNGYYIIYVKDGIKCDEVLHWGFGLG